MSELEHILEELGYDDMRKELLALRAHVAELKAICFDHELNFGAAEEEVARLAARVAELEGWLEERGGCVRCGDSNEWQDGDKGADGLCMPCYADRRETLNRKEEE